MTGQVGTITRDDGTVQATLDGWPLSHWQGDTAPGDVTGQVCRACGESSRPTALR